MVKSQILVGMKRTQALKIRDSWKIPQAGFTGGLFPQFK